MCGVLLRSEHLLLQKAKVRDDMKSKPQCEFLSLLENIFFYLFYTEYFYVIFLH